MKRLSMQWNVEFVTDVVWQARRRCGWFVENLTPGKLWNLLIANAEFLLKREAMQASPVSVKIDISPLCNLHCTVCIHAHPAEGSVGALQDQVFSGHQKMRLDQFKRITEELSGKTTAVSLYYLGDPLMHPDLDTMCRMAAEAGLNSHVSTNFSFKLPDERIASIVASGLTHLTVCVDGLSQEKYGRTRVGGRIEVVLDNLERLMRSRRESGRRYPKVEVQFIKFQHNVDELPEAMRRFRALGVDQVTNFWGSLHNYTDLIPQTDLPLKPQRPHALSQCYWPYFGMVIKYDGDVIPCCQYRWDAQYSRSGERRIVGNVFTSSIAEVWNSVEYQKLRRLVANPERVYEEGALAQSFCAGCPMIFETDVASHMRRAELHRWEDLYTVDERERVVRKREPDHAQLVSPSCG